MHVAMYVTRRQKKPYSTSENIACLLACFLARCFQPCPAGSLLGGGGGEDVRITWVDDGHAGDTEVLSAGGSKGVVVPGVDKSRRVVLLGNLCEHGVVLNLGLAKGRAVVRHDDEACLSLPEELEGLLVAELVLSRLDDKLEIMLFATFAHASAPEELKIPRLLERSAASTASLEGTWKL